MTEAGVSMQGLLVASCGLQVAGRALRGALDAPCCGLQGARFAWLFQRCSVSLFPHFP